MLDGACRIEPFLVSRRHQHSQHFKSLDCIYNYFSWLITNIYINKCVCVGDRRTPFVQ